jgi:hypothetical protein
MDKHKFKLIFDPQNGPTYKQYKNLMRWLEERNIEYDFERVSPGNFYPCGIIMSKEDALIFGLSFKSVAVEDKT